VPKAFAKAVLSVTLKPTSIAGEEFTIRIN